MMERKETTMNRREQGFSSLELAVAVGLLFLISTYLMGTFTMSARYGASATQVNEFNSLLQAKATELRTYDFQSLVFGTGTPPAMSGRFTTSPEYGWDIRLMGAPPGHDPAWVQSIEITVTRYKDAVSTVAVGRRKLNTLTSRLYNLSRGELVFRKYACDQCHTIATSRYDYDPDPNSPRVPLNDLLAQTPTQPDGTPMSVNPSDGTFDTLQDYIDGRVAAMDPNDALPGKTLEETALQQYISDSIVVPDFRSRYVETGQDPMASTITHTINSADITPVSEFVMEFQSTGTVP